MKKLFIIPLLFLSFMLFAETPTDLESKVTKFLDSGNYMRLQDGDGNVYFYRKENIVTIAFPEDGYMLQITTSNPNVGEYFYFKQYFFELDENNNMIVTAKERNVNEK